MPGKAFYILVLLSLLVVPQPHAKPGTVHLLCSTFKQGHFTHRYIDAENSDYSFSFHIIREDSTQLEINEKTGDTSKYKIWWMEECKYELALISTTLKLSPAEFNLRRSVPLETIITDRGKDYYLFIARRNNEPFSPADTIWVRK